MERYRLRNLTIRSLRRLALRRLLPLGCCLLLLEGLSERPQPAYAADEVFVTNDEILIASHIDLVPGFGCESGCNLAGLAKRWSKAIEKYWDKGFSFCGRKVTFRADVQVAALGSVRPEAHAVLVRKTRSGQDFVSDVVTPGNSDPSTQNFVADWRSNADDNTIAHEFGHIEGLPDEYMETVVDGVRTTEPCRSMRMTTRSWRNMGGVVLPRQVAEIIRKHSKLRNVYPCRWEGTIHLQLTASGSGVSYSGTADGTVVLTENTAGALVGHIQVQRTSGCTLLGRSGR